MADPIDPRRALMAQGVSTGLMNLGSQLLALGTRGRVGGQMVQPPNVMDIYRMQAEQQAAAQKQAENQAFASYINPPMPEDVNRGGTGQSPMSLAAEPQRPLPNLGQEERGLVARLGVDHPLSQSILMATVKPPAAPKPTALMQNLEAAGLAPGTPEYREAVLAGIQRGTEVNINQAAEAKGMEALDKAIGSNLAAQVESGNKARSSVARIGQMRDLVQKFEAAGGETGAFAPIRLRAGEAVRSLGLPQDFFGLPGDAEISYGQVIESLSNQLALGKIGGEDGMPANNFSEADRNFIVSTVAGLGDSPAAFRRKLAIQERMDQRAMEIERVILEGRESRKSVSDIRSDIQRIVAQPLFSDEEREGLDKAPTPTPTFTPRTPEEYQQMSDDELLRIIRGGS